MVRITLAAIAVLATAVGALSAQGSALNTYHVPSTGLGRNLLGMPAGAQVEVYLPRNYGPAPTRRFPVLYLLHGIQGTSADWTRPGYQGMTIQGVMDSLSAVGAIDEFIVVVPTANNPYSGSFYVNSPVTGQWEDFLSRELVAWVDSAFRTIASPAGRGIAGHSMGGYGAVIMAMRHGDVFGAAWAMSPCCLAAVEDIGTQNDVWQRMTSFRNLSSLQQAAMKGDFYPLATIALAAVLSPNVSRPPFFVDLPFESAGDSVRPAPPVWARWQAAMPVAQVASAGASLSALREPLRLDYGYRDQFPHIPPGVRMLSDSLAAYRVPHLVEAYDGDHRNRIRQRMTEVVLPFFSRVFGRID